MPIKIMVIDDDPGILNLIKSMVEPLGCEVFATTDSQGAAEIVRRHKFDGIFVDAHMPRVDGFQLTQVIRSSPSNNKVPIVMLTGYDDAETMRQGFSAGISFFLGKPITQERMIRLVNALRGTLLKEKRRYVRLIFRAPVDCKRKSRGPAIAKACGLDISEGGMALIQAENLDVGDEVNLEFQLPAVPETMSLLAQVVRKMPPDGIGVMFVELSPDARNAIRRFIMRGAQS
jgi:CheY-like chemotaxis protein